MNDHERREQLRYEIALLRAIRDARAAARRAEDDEHGAWVAATKAGVPECDADVPEDAIKERDAELTRLIPERQMRDAGAATLPGLDL